MMKFRTLTRKKQGLSILECEELLSSSLRGVLAVNGDNGYPYAMPLNHFYDKETKTIYFHSGKIGYKMDCIDRSSKACFTVMDQGVRREGEWWLTIRSIIVMGRIKRLEDPKTVEEVSRRLSHKFTKDEEYISREIEEYAAATAILAMTVEDIQGKTVKEK